MNRFARERLHEEQDDSGDEEQQEHEGDLHRTNVSRHLD